MRARGARTASTTSCAALRRSASAPTITRTSAATVQLRLQASPVKRILSSTHSPLALHYRFDAVHVVFAVALHADGPRNVAEPEADVAELNVPDTVVPPVSKRNALAVMGNALVGLELTVPSTVQLPP